MRHLGSLVLSLVLAPIIWALTGIGLVEYGPARGRLDSDLVLALAALVAAGTLFAVLVVAKISPVGPMLVGLAYLGMLAWATLDNASLQATMPRSVLGTGAALTYPADGVAALLAIPLLATAFGAGRWRRERLPGRHAVAAGQVAGSDLAPGSSDPDASDSLVEPVPTAPGSPAAERYPWSGPGAALPQRRSEERTVVLGAADSRPESDETTSLLIAPTPRHSIVGARAPQDAGTVPDAGTAQGAGVPQGVGPAAGGETPPDPGTAGAAPAEGAQPPDDGGIPPAPPSRRRRQHQAVDADDATRPLRGTPPPPAAYPPPGHSTPTASPVDPEATGRL